MKKILKDVIVLTFIVLIFIYAINYNGYISGQVMNAFMLWINAIIPSVLPTLIIIDLLYTTKIPYFINKYLHINIIYIMAVVGGSPSNAVMVNKMDKYKEKMLAVTKYVSLIFLYNSLRVIFSKRIAIILILSNILANIILILILKPRGDYEASLGKLSEIPANIKKYMHTLLLILGTIIIFNSLPVFLIDNQYIQLLVSSLLEVTGFFNLAYEIALPLKYKLFCSMIAISTCGLCIECQIKSIINDTSIDYKKYLYWRLIHLILFMFIASVLIMSL